MEKAAKNKIKKRGVQIRDKIWVWHYSDKIKITLFDEKIVVRVNNHDYGMEHETGRHYMLMALGRL